MLLPWLNNKIIMLDKCLHVYCVVFLSWFLLTKLFFVASHAQARHFWKEFSLTAEMGTPAFFEILSVDRKKNYKKKQASQKALVLSLSNESSDGQISTSEQVSNSQSS